MKHSEKKSDVTDALGDEDEKLGRIYGRETTKNEKIYLLSRDFALGKMSYQKFMEKISLISN